MTQSTDSPFPVDPPPETAAPKPQAPADPSEDHALAVSRRSFMKGAGLTMAAVSIAGPAGASQTQQKAPPLRVVGPNAVAVNLQINGKSQKVEVEPGATLLNTIRDRVGLTGSKRVCDRGSCGACTMLVDGEPINSCSYLAVDAENKSITTVEGFAKGDELSKLQAAFVECDALQCGFCTPGMVVACEALIQKNSKPSRSEVAQGIAGNLCRCGTYQNIFEAVALATGQANRRPEAPVLKPAAAEGGQRAKF